MNNKGNLTEKLYNTFITDNGSPLMAKVDIKMFKYIIIDIKLFIVLDQYGFKGIPSCCFDKFS